VTLLMVTRVTGEELLAGAGGAELFAGAGGAELLAGAGQLFPRAGGAKLFVGAGGAELLVGAGGADRFAGAGGAELLAGAEGGAGGPGGAGRPPVELLGAGGGPGGPGGAREGSAAILDFAFADLKLPALLAGGHGTDGGLEISSTDLIFCFGKATFSVRGASFLTVLIGSLTMPLSFESPLWVASCLSSSPCFLIFL